jgi:hypothetical protein
MGPAAAQVRKCRFVVSVTLTQGDTLADTNDDTSSNEAADISAWRERLDQCRDDSKKGAESHSHFSTLPIGQRPTQEKACYDSADRVCRVDRSNHLSVLAPQSVNARSE